MIKPFGHALPYGKRAFFLKKRIDRSLKKSLSDIVSLCYEEGWCEPFIIPHHPTQYPLLDYTSPFLYTLLGKLLTACEENNAQMGKEYIDELKHLLSLNHNKIINYQCESITNKLWNEVDHISFQEIPEGGSSAPCPPQLWKEGQRLIEDALCALKYGAKDAYEEHIQLVNHFIILKSERFIAGSSFDIQGCILMKIKENHLLLDIIDNIIHETAHQYIFLLSTLDPLCLNDPADLYTSPLREDPRPIMGNFHALFVISRLIYALKSIKSYPKKHDIDVNTLQQYIENYEEKFNLALPSFYRDAHLTALGRRLMRSAESAIK